ncbi:hypothetical protein O7600_16505 [Micromonospora sp. WMMA1998]|uniref:hypothetical protein n=1 Tax=Micromonospora sp. WMMA1998 TaxID=3015167 RepID=UPI00248C2FDD|nr:hypothetical protein [Micromonospora sp. WMMA1998]WBC12785.1 hypothetical protein O7600_16505 [Micromonospora sp. WMMA1998]
MGRRSSGSKNRDRRQILVDEAGEKLTSFALDLWQDIYAEQNSFKLIEKFLQKEGVPPNSSLSGPPAFELLESLSEILEERAAEYAARHTYHRLIQRLRLLPAPIYGSWHFKSPNSYMERREWAEVLAFKYASPPAAGPIYFADQILIDQKNLPALLRFAEVTRIYASMQVLKRCAAMDIPILFEEGKLPDVDRIHPLWAAMQRLDQRRGAHLGYFGVILNKDSGFELPSPDDRFIVATITLSNAWTDHTYVDWFKDVGVRLASFSYIPVGSRIPGLMRGHRWYPPSLPYLALASTAMILKFGQDRASDLAIRRYGLVTMSRRLFERNFEALLQSPTAQMYANFFPSDHPLTMDGMMNALNDPLQAHPDTKVPVLVSAGSDAVVLDLWALGRKILLDMNSPSTGEVQNVRAENFELEVQRMIDASGWAPPAELRSLVRRTLRRRDGSSITDIDALAVKDGVGILIACKNYRTTALGRATAPQARTVRSQLAHDYTDWERKVSALWASPGPNYDLTGLVKAIPLVLTPDPTFVDPALLQPRDNQLPSVMALYEFESFLFKD